MSRRSSHCARFVPCFVLIGLAHAALPAHAQSATFSERAAEAGIAVTHDRPEPTFHFYGGGACGDFDNDGWQDLYVAMGGVEPDRLFINNRDGTFSDRAAAWGVDIRHRGNGVAVGDFNNDGRLDIFLTSDGGPEQPEPGRHVLWRNDGGHFTDVAAQAGVQWTSVDTYDGFSAAFGDYDLDGDLDLAVAGWYTGSGGNRLFRNNADETFTDVTAGAILRSMSGVRGYSPRFLDMNGDRYPELLWVADFGTTAYLVNNRDGTFSDQTAAAGAGVERNGMGQAVGDFNNDGLPDWYISSIFADYGPIGERQGNVLYIHQPDDTFAEIAEAAGVINGGWGWGTVAVDLNHDGWTDIVETNGWFPIEWRYEQTYVFMNNGDLHFTESAAAVGINHFGQGRGLLNFDYDNDGDQDLVLIAFREPLCLYRNEISGAGTNWLRVVLDTTRRADVAPNGFGAKVRVRTGVSWQTRWIDGGSNYLSQSELAAHFGLGSATVIDELRVDWPNGRQTVLHELAVNQTLTVFASLSGDLDGDLDVDLADLSGVLTSFDTCAGDDGFASAADVNADGCVTLADVLALLTDFGVADR